MAGGARGVAHAGGGVFVEALPGEIAVDLADPFLVGDGVLQRRRRHVRCIGQHDVALDGFQPGGVFLQDRQERQIDEHHAVLGMIDDPADLVGETAAG